MDNTKKQLIEEVESLKEIRRIMRKRRFLLEEQLAAEGLQSRPQLTIEIEKILEREEMLNTEIFSLENLINANSTNIHTNTEASLPEDLRIELLLRRSLLSVEQVKILRYIEHQIINRKRQLVKQDLIEKEFVQYSGSEIYYRLEHLRLLGFLEKEKGGQDKNGGLRFIYRLTNSYEARLKGHLVHYDIKPGNIFLDSSDKKAPEIKIDLKDLNLPDKEDTSRD